MKHKRKFKSTLCALLSLVLLFSMSGTIFASLDNHNTHDIILAQSQDNNSYYFPDVINVPASVCGTGYPNGKLLAAFYKNTVNTPEATDPKGTICIVESVDNGLTWSTPAVVVDRSSEGLDVRDPNLTVMPDGTVILAYFAGTLVNTTLRTYIMTSSDGGANWSAPITVESTILSSFNTMGGSIAILDNNNILVPIYGVGPGTSTEPGYHRDAVAVHYSRGGGSWQKMDEYLIGQELGGTALVCTGGSTVYAFASEAGNVYISENSGATWTLIANEEPRFYQTQTISMLSDAQILQPKIIQVDSDRYFVTYSNPSSMINPWDVNSRIVYGKMFYPDAGWYATTSRVIYDGMGNSGWDMAGPAPVLTNDGRLLVIYYDRSLKAIAGSFTELNEWPSPQQEMCWRFLEDDFSSMAWTDSNFLYSGKYLMSWADGRLHWASRPGDFVGILTNQKISGNYTLQFDFQYEVVDPNATYNEAWFKMQHGTNAYKITITPDALSIYNGSALRGVVGGDVLAASKPASFETGSWYTVKCSKFYDYLYVKAWPAGDPEPLAWDLSVHSWVFGTPPSSTPDTNEWDFFIRYTSDIENQYFAIDNLKVCKNTVMTINKTSLDRKVGLSGEDLQLSASFYPNIYGQKPAPSYVTYQSSNESVVTPLPVSDTNRTFLNFLSVGTATLTATMQDLEASCAVTSGSIGSQMELFVDDELIDQMDGVSLRMHEFQKAPASQKPFPRSYYTTVIKDGDLYRGYYRVESTVWGQRYCYAESTDGINWELPALGILPNDASTMPNVIIDEYPFVHNFSPFLDTNPCANPNERYKAIAGYKQYGGTLPEGIEHALYTYTSSDGIHWTRNATPILYFDEEYEWAFDSQNVAFWSPAEQCYVLYFRQYSTPYGLLRSVGRATSKDFINWTDETATFETPNYDDEQLYTNTTFPYFRTPHIYIALPTRYAIGMLDGVEVPGNVGSTDILLMSSRAGQNSYTRLFNEALLRPGVNPASWDDRGNYLCENVVPTGLSEISTYHRNGERYVLRTDGFVSVNAPSTGGELVTKPFIFDGKHLMLNFSTSITGYIAVELQEPDGTPLTGFTAENSVPLVGDSIERAVTWKLETGDPYADVSQFAGQPIRIRFIMSDCDLYSYKFGTSVAVDVESIDADFTQTGTVYTLSNLDDLKSMLVVTATTVDEETFTIPPEDYTVRGPLMAGENIITVWYNGLQDTFTVTATTSAPASVDAVFTQTDTVYTSTSLDSLKSMLVVTGTNNNGTTFPITDAAYTLSGTLEVGESTITVNYLTLTDTFTVTVSSQ